MSRSRWGVLVALVGLPALASATPPELVAPQGAGSFELALVGERVVWAGYSSDPEKSGAMLVMAAPKVTEPTTVPVPPQVLATVWNTITGVVVVDELIVFSEQGSAMSGPRCKDCPAPRSYTDGTINLVGKGGKHRRLAKKQLGPMGLATDGKFVYWVNAGDDLPDSGAIMRIAAKGGGAKRLGKFVRARGVAVDDTHAYVIVDGVDDKTPGELVRLKKLGGKHERLASVLGPRHVVVDGSHVYVAGSSEIVRVPRQGGLAEVLARKQADPLKLALTATHVVWTTSQGGQVQAVPKAGGTVVTLASGEMDAAGIATDATHVYWSSRKGLSSLPKP